MAARGVLLISCAAAGAAAQGNLDFNYTYHASRLFNDLMQNYVKQVAPTSVRRVSYSSAGTDVQMQLRLFKLRTVSTAEGIMELRVWWRLWWTDLRLSWNPDDYGGISSIMVKAADHTKPEASDIWLPDIQVYNAAMGSQNTMDPSDAQVSSNGQVHWSRPGNLKVLCRFSGLIMFPIGEFSCPVEIGGWLNGGEVQGLSSADASVTDYPGCADIASGHTDETGKGSYQEVRLVKVECEEHVYSYPCCPSNPFPVIKYRIYLKRATSFFVFTTMVPSTLFTLLSFTPFFMSFEAGERLSVGVTLVLTIEISRAALVSTLPICGEWLWLEILFFVNLVFTVAAFLESCLVIGLSWTTEQSVLPIGVAAAYGRVRRWLGDATQDSESIAGRFLRQAIDSGSLEVNRAGKAVMGRSGKSIFGLPRLVPLHRAHGSASGDRRGSEKRQAAASPPPSPPETSKPPQRTHATTELSNEAIQEATHKLIFFESLFFSLDVDGSDYILFDEMRRMLAFTALTMTNAEREEALKQADTDLADGRLSRYEFMDLCVATMWDQPLADLNRAAAAYSEYRERLKKRANSSWRTVAVEIDRFSRFWFPALYLVFFATTLNTEFLDNNIDLFSNATAVANTSQQIVDEDYKAAEYLDGITITSTGSTASASLVTLICFVLIWCGLKLHGMKTRHAMERKAADSGSVTAAKYEQRNRELSKKGNMLVMMRKVASSGRLLNSSQVQPVMEPVRPLEEPVQPIEEPVLPVDPKSVL